MKTTLNLTLSLLLIIIGISSCKSPSNGNNELTSAERESGWKLLFDGKTSNGWHLYNKGNVKSAWQVIDSNLVCTDNPDLEHGDLVSDEKFTNYDLRFEWKLQATGNSGVFINVQETSANPTAWASGPEYQLLGAEHPDMHKPVKKSGCLYGFSKQLNEVDVKPADQWNTSRIVQENGKISFYLNGKITAQEDFKDPKWQSKIDTTNFKNFPNFGKATTGSIALQDWTKGIAFRNIKIKAL